MIRVLSIAWYKILPAKYGGQKGIAFFNQELAKHFPLVCLCSENNEPPGVLPYKVIPGLPVSKGQFLSPATWKIVQQTAIKENVTHVILEHPYHGIAAIKARRQTGFKLIIHSHNIESLRFRLLGKWWWRLLARYEKWVLRRADLNLFKTESDQHWAINNFGLDAGKCMVVPYGIALYPFKDNASSRALIQQRHSILPHEKILLFAATLDYLPNAKAVEAIFHEVVPRLKLVFPNFKVIICGRNINRDFHYLQTLKDEHVIMAGEVEDIDEYFAVADVFINPVHTGGGVQTKNMDALARHCNVVCFDAMIDKEVQALVPGKVLTAPTGNWDEFVKQVTAGFRERIPTNESFFKAYSWERIIATVAERIRLL